MQSELGTRCTGTLLGPRLVATAAHCLIAPRSGNPMQPGSLHVLLAYDRGRHQGHAEVAAFELGQGWTNAATRRPADDWALLRLASPLPPDRALPVQRQPPAAGTAVMLGGWQRDRPEVLLADTECRFLGRTADAGRPMLLHGCTALNGVSGGPLLARQPDGGWALIGIASIRWRGTTLGAAVPAAALPLP